MIWAVLQYTQFNYEMHVHNLLIFLFLSNDCGVSFEVSPHCDELIFAIWIERLSWLILRVVWMFNVVWFVFFLSQIKLPLIISEAYFNYRTCLIQQLIERENVMINEKKNVLNTNKEKNRMRGILIFPTQNYIEMIGFAIWCCVNGIEMQIFSLMDN